MKQVVNKQVKNFIINIWQVLRDSIYFLVISFNRDCIFRRAMILMAKYAFSLHLLGQPLGESSRFCFNYWFKLHD